MQSERELELYKELEDLEERSLQCEKMERKLEQLEDDMIWQNRCSKELNDDLFACYPKDQKMQRHLLDREEMLEQKTVRGRSFFRELQESIYEMKISETLQVLQDNLHLFQDKDAIYNVREKRSGRHIRIECTYEEAGIYSGSELVIDA